jgi:hypothetical protein
MAPPSLISSTWFAIHERTTATAVMICSNNMGSAAGFFAPFIVHQPDDLRTLLWIQFGLAAAAFAMSLFSPAVPKTAPAVTSHVESNAVGAAAVCREIWRDFVVFSKSGSSMVLALVGGLFAGCFNCWSGNLDVIITGAVVVVW